MARANVHLKAFSELSTREERELGTVVLAAVTVPLLHGEPPTEADRRYAPLSCLRRAKPLTHMLSNDSDVHKYIIMRGAKVIGCAAIDEGWDPVEMESNPVVLVAAIHPQYGQYRHEVMGAISREKEEVQRDCY